MALLSVAQTRCAAVRGFQENVDDPSRFGLFKAVPTDICVKHLGLETEIAMLKSGLVRLLTDTNLDDQLILELVEDASTKRWSEKAVEEALRMRLTHSFDIYLETVSYMNEKIEEFRKLLILGPQWEVRHAIAPDCHVKRLIDLSGTFRGSRLLQRDVQTLNVHAQEVGLQRTDSANA